MNRRTLFRMLLAAPLAVAAAPLLLPRKPETVTVKLVVDDREFRRALHAEGERIMEEAKQMRPLHLTPPYADGLVRRP